MDKQYGIKIKDPKERRTILATVRTMAHYIMEHGRNATGPMAHVN